MPVPPQQQRREKELRKQQEREQRRHYEEQMRREEERRRAEHEQVTRLQRRFLFLESEAFLVSAPIFCHLRADRLIVDAACVAFHRRDLFPCGSTCWPVGAETLDAGCSHTLVPGAGFCGVPG